MTRHPEVTGEQFQLSELLTIGPESCSGENERRGSGMAAHGR
jgi:hypothetical protein